MASHLIFTVNTTRYAIAAEAVRTTFWLPDLSPVEDLPPWFVGLVNLHGEVIPVVDLGRRLGHPDRPYRLDQAVILLEQDGLRAGLVADEVLDLIDLGADAAAPYVRLAEDDTAAGPPVIAGTLKWTDGVLIEIDVGALLRPLPAGEPASAPVAAGERFAELSTAAADRLRERTLRLAAPRTPPNAGERLYALVRIGTGCYAIALEQIAEFTRLGACTPIPCCPPHIIGCVNLRGAILTVLDMGPMFEGQPMRDYEHIAVLRLGDLQLGLAVHQVQDIRAAGALALTSVAGPAYGHPYCKWMLQHPGGVAGVLDAEALLAQGIFDVNERV